MGTIELKEMLKLHSRWLQGDSNGQRADLRNADLQYANLQYADLRNADLQGADLQNVDLRNADLQGADLRNADLQGADLQNVDLRNANLQGANLRYADLRNADLQGANLDFSCLPLWCGSFNVKCGDRLVYQLIAHLARLNVSRCSDEAKAAIKALNPWRNEFRKYRADIAPIENL